MCDQDVEKNGNKADKGAASMTPDSSSDAPVAQRKAAQVPRSLPIPQIYPPLEYPPLDVEMDGAPPPTPSTSPPTDINTPPLSPRMVMHDEDHSSKASTSTMPVTGTLPQELKHRQQMPRQQPDGAM